MSAVDGGEEYQRQLQAFQELSSAFLPTTIVLSAIELGLFSALEGRPQSAEELAAAHRLDRHALETLLAALVSLDYLECEAGRYRNSEFAARALVAGSKEYEGDTALMSLWFMRQMCQLSDTVRSGRGRESFEEAVSESPARAAWLASAMDQVARNYCDSIADHLNMRGVRRLLDVGGAEGSLARAMLAANSEAEADIFELPHVATAARRRIREHGLAHRIKVVEGDFRTDDLGKGYDLVFFSNIFHLCDKQLARELIGKAARALNPGGRLAIKDVVPRRGESMPPAMAMFNVVAMTISTGGCLHDEESYAEWCLEAGLERPERLDCWERPSLLIARRVPG